MDFLLEAFCAAGLYRPARLARNRFVRPELWHRTLQWRRFYSQFVSPGDLVFDVGANRGDRTETFVQLGARVVAVEPSEEMAARLERIFRYCPVEVEAVGLARATGVLQLHVCDTSAECSSFSKEFMERQSRRTPGLRWTPKEQVPVVTADSLIQKYGVPRFMKIDTEGFEREVLAGLSHPIPSLSFEVLSWNSADYVRELLGQASRLDNYEFNLSFEESLVFELPIWGDAGAVWDALRRSDPTGWRYGDVYARLPQLQ